MKKNPSLTLFVAEEEPVTEPPVNEPSVEEEPVTDPLVAEEEPVTDPPVNEPPVEEEPVTEPPIDEKEPVTDPPVNEPPVEEEPVTEPPIDEKEPVTDPLVVDEEEPVTEPPVIDEEEPVTEPPTEEEEPVTELPVTEEEPVEEEEPVTELPTEEEPVTEPPVSVEQFNLELSNLELTEVQRFYNYEAGYHFYSVDANESQELSANNEDEYNYEGESFTVLNSNLDYNLTGEVIETAQPVYQFFNNDTNALLFTMSENEKDYILDNLDNYESQGIAYYAFETEPEDIETVPVYRLLNTDTGTHMLTSDRNEIDYIQNNLSNFDLENNSEAVFYALEAN